MITIKVSKNIISVQETEPLTSGSVSVYKCRFVFDASWDGFFRSAVFRVGSLVKTAPLDAEDMCDLPWELLEKQYIGLPVEVSVYGTKEETEILPTIWDKLGRVRKGSEPGEDVQKYSPSVYERIVSLIKAYSDKTKGDKGDKGDPGEGDMNAAVYDPQGRKTDAFKYADEQIARIPNPNLLHNWYFANCVNQRGQAEYIGAGYTIDRWYGVVATSVVTVGDGITVKGVGGYGYFSQKLENPKTLVGEYTLAFLVTAISGTAYIQMVGDVSGTKASKAITSPGLYFVTKTLDGSDTSVRCQIRISDGGDVTLKAAKLELGSTQTLAHQDADGNWVLNEIPDYNEESLKCCMSTADPSDTYANNKRTPAAVGAVNKAGDTMTGNLDIIGSTPWVRWEQKADTGRELYLQANSSGALSLLNRQKSDQSAYTQLLLNKESIGLDRLLRLVVSGTGYSVLHTGNKPSGSYTGNGSATARTIETGGIGNALLLRGGNGASAIISNAGAIIWDTSGVVTVLSNNEINFWDGVLTIKTTNSFLNASGVTYNYQVL